MYTVLGMVKREKVKIEYFSILHVVFIKAYAK
jgi:hypothetical protein